MNIYITRNEQQLGPYTIAQIQEMLQARTVTLADYAWYEGLPDWVPLLQIPGVSIPSVLGATTITPPATLVEGTPKRPVLVWIICLLNFTCLPFGLLSLMISPTLLVNMGNLPEAQHQYFSGLGLFNYYIPVFLSLGLALIWAVQLFRLKRNSLHFLLASFGVSFIAMILEILVPGWYGANGISGIVGMGVGWGINLLLLYYNWYLFQKGTLR